MIPLQLTLGLQPPPENGCGGFEGSNFVTIPSEDVLGALGL